VLNGGLQFRVRGCDDAKCRSSFLQDGKPSRSDRKSSHARRQHRHRILVWMIFADIFVDTWRNGHFAKYPGLVFDDRHDTGREEVFAE